MPNYLMTDASIGFMEGSSGDIDWVGWGFDPIQVRIAVARGFQQASGNRLVNLFPIKNEELLKERLKEIFLGNDFMLEIISESEAVTERDRLKSINDAEEEVRRNTPTEDDIFKAQQLLMLTQINAKLGGTSHV